MGSFYTNITLRNPQQDRIIAVLEQFSRTAYVSPVENGFTVVFDKDCEQQDTDVLESLTADLSRQLQCSAFAVLNHDDDVLLYRLYDRGDLVDRYDYPSDYFDPGEEPAVPSEENVQKLCRIFGKPQSAEEIKKILGSSWDDDDGYLFAVERHEALAQALGLPSCSVGLGYKYIAAGDAPGFGLDADSLKHVG